MTRISNDSIKRFVKEHAKVNMTNDAASALAKILEGKAKTISKFAVRNAKKDGRSKITKEDILKYIMNNE